MKKSLKTLLPALLIAAISTVLIGLYYLRIPVMHMIMIQGLQLHGTRTFEKIFTMMAQGAILLGAASFSWFIFKKKLKTSMSLVKMVGKKVYNLHSFFGWTALILVILHGGYFLITDFSNRNNLTGIAAFLILACIAVYGILLKRLKNKSIKKVHFLLTAVWLVAILIHGGGLVILSCGLLIGLYIALSYLGAERREGSRNHGDGSRVSKLNKKSI